MALIRSVRAVLLGVMMWTMFATAVRAEEVYVEHETLTLNADLVLAESKSIADGITIIVHGTLGHKDMDTIETLQTAFQEAGFSSLAINLSLGVNDRHGFFPCDMKHAHRSEDTVDELQTWVRWLKKRGASSIQLLGHSRGGNQAAKFVLANEGLISKLVLLAPSASETILANDEIQALEGIGADEWLSSVDFLHCTDSDVQVDTFFSYIGAAARNDTVALLTEVRIPTLVISGSEDAVVTDLTPRAANVANGLVSHIEIEGAGHFFRDLYAYDVIDAVDVFLSASKSPARVIELAASFYEDAMRLSEPAKFFVVFVSQADCGHCERLRQKILYPTIRRHELDDRIELREVSLDAGFEFIDFQGMTVGGRQFAERYVAFVTPTLLFLDSSGRTLVEPLIGTGNIEFYGFYLSSRIDEATKALAAP